MKRKLHNFIFCLIFLCAILIFHFSAIAQVMFQKQFVTSNLSEVKQTADSGFIAVGWNNLSGTQDVILVKTNSFGDTMWTKTYGEAEDVIGFSVDLTSDNGYIILGGSYPNSFTGAKVYLIKTNSTGDTLWTKKFGGVGAEWGREIHQTFDGGFIIAGETNSFGAGNNDMYIIKTDSIGSVQWSRAFGSVNEDRCYSICQTADSGFVAIGRYNAFSSNADIVIIRMNSVGDTLWCKEYGGLSSDSGADIKQIFNHGFAIAGSTGSFGSGSGDLFLLITDSLGNLSTFKTYGGTDGESAYNLYQTSDSGYVICGGTFGFGASNFASYLVRTNSNGSLVWSRVYNLTQNGLVWNIAQTFDGGFITAGEQNELMKLNSNGVSGCLEDTAATIVTIDTIPELNLPITVTISNTITSTTETTVGSGVTIYNHCISVNNNEITPVNYSIQIFPNPANVSFTVQRNSPSKKLHLEIYNVLGERINIEMITETHTTVSCKQFRSGIYFMKVTDGDSVYCKKLIVEHN